MTCPCGHEFCWICMKDYFHKKENVYSPHEQFECVFILILKVFLVITCFLALVMTSVGHEGFRVFTSWLWSILTIIFRTLILDLYFSAQFFLCRIVATKNHRGRRSFLQSINSKKFVFMMLGINLLAILLIYSIG